MAKDAESGERAVIQGKAAWVNHIDDEESEGKDVPRVRVTLKTTVAIDWSRDV
jgi:hypothetical protein